MGEAAPVARSGGIVEVSSAGNRSIPNPAAGAVADDAGYPALQQTAAGLEIRIGFLLAVLTGRPHPESEEKPWPGPGGWNRIHLIVHDPKRRSHRGLDRPPQRFVERGPFRARTR